jgi:putative transcriptional regulator
VTTDPAADDRTSSLAQQLLCAVPQLVDPNFVRSVVFIVDHTPQGAFGLVLNNVLPTAISEFAEAVGLEWEGAEDATLRLGGPVEPVRAFLVHDQAEWDPLADIVAPGAYLTASLEGVQRDSGPKFGATGQYAVFLGYAGWGPGQLESEMAQGTWMAVPVRDAAARGPGVPVPWIWTADPEAMWHEALASIGIDPAWLIGGTLGVRRGPQA